MSARRLHRRTVLGGLGALALSNLAVSALGRGVAYAAPVGRLALVGGTLLRPDAEPLKDAVIVIENGERRQLRELGASRLDLEVVLQALTGALPAVAHVDRASDILTILRLARDNGLRLVLASAAEGWKVAKAIAEAEVPALIYGLDDGPRSFAALGAREDNAALLHAAGVSVSLSTGQSHNARKLRQVAGNAVRTGLPPAAALAAVTEAPTRALGMGDEYGTPQVGRAANLAVWSADPFELSTRLEVLLIRGRKVSLRSRQTALYERYR